MWGKTKLNQRKYALTLTFMGIMIMGLIGWLGFYLVDKQYAKLFIPLFVIGLFMGVGAFCLEYKQKITRCGENDKQLEKA